MNPIWFIFFSISSTKNVTFENNLTFLLLCKIYLKTNCLLKQQQFKIFHDSVS